MSPRELPDEGSPEYWLTRARSVLALAQSVEPPRETLPADLWYLAQQACEKALKGVCEHVGISPPLTHDLNLLVDLLDEQLPVPHDVRRSAELTRYAVNDRYLGALDGVNHVDLAEAVEIASAVVEWATTSTEDA